ncbi:MAG TPA: VWA domain-containing protein [Sandaracinaceae bacterium LLY-WYZ-13_1]|nr:VWA domain-containing protein [Sandaracinaceae bacterium LLY-WYZ-13_1]
MTSDPVERAILGRAADPASRDPRWADVTLAAALFAVDPRGLGGVVLRGGPGPRRDRVVAWLRGLSPPDDPWVPMPAHITDDRLLGGLSLAATLRGGRVVAERGLLARADGGVVVVPMAERLETTPRAHLCAALDRREVTLEREGIGAVLPCRLGVVALDEGLGDEGIDPGLADRLAFRVDLGALDRGSLPEASPDPERVEAARGRLADTTLADEAIDALCRGAVALGVSSFRAPILATKVARAHAAWVGRHEVEAEDLAAASRLVLAPRATRVPASEPAEPEAPEEREDGEEDEDGEEPRAPERADADGDDAERDPEPPPEGPDGDDGTGDDAARGPTPEEIVLEAAEANLPAGLLDALRLGSARRGPRRAGRAGVVGDSATGGRPAGTRAGAPRPGERLDVVATLRAAAPWQRLRRGVASRVEVRRSDFRTKRFRKKAETTVIFAVDASGSSALRRLAEAKGAVEQVLSDCYVRRDHVALIAFREDRAALVLPPTRSLARARRRLASMVGGGATPLASGLEAAHRLALDARRRGSTPLVVVMTDGRANVARDGRRDGAAATGDARAAARELRADGVPVLFLDTAPRPRRRARELADAMAATYLPLPHLDARDVSRHVRGLAEAG